MIHLAVMDIISLWPNLFTVPEKTLTLLLMEMNVMICKKKKHIKSILHLNLD